MATGKLCTQCGKSQKAKGLQRCLECALDRMAPVDREAAADARLAMIPPSLRRARVPASEWPEGRRWCAGCQSMVRLRDCGPNASRCRTCVGRVQHASMVERTYEILDPETGARRPFTSRDYERLFQLQGGRCASCGNRSVTKRMAVDHDHRTGLVRGLLCPGEYGCNLTVMGKIDKDEDPVAMALRILNYYQHPPASRL